jgi:hypothetical protein
VRVRRQRGRSVSGVDAQGLGMTGAGPPHLAGRHAGEQPSNRCAVPEVVGRAQDRVLPNHLVVEAGGKLESGQAHGKLDRTRFQTGSPFLALAEDTPEPAVGPG